jgi:hypothetical protein
MADLLRVNQSRSKESPAWPEKGAAFAARCAEGEQETGGLSRTIPVLDLELMRAR